MKTSFVASGLMAAGALASPLATRQSTNIDAIVLQFALTLEHLENNFYHGALQKFSVQDFINAGYTADYYNNLKYISFDEQSHVSLLSSALSAAGATPVKACTYNFGYTDVKSFITLSSVLEGVGTSAYLAGAPLITSKQYLTVAGSILVAEALHTSMQRSAIGEVPMANPYGTPLDPTSVYTLAAMFIASCPAGNVALPFVPFPTLSYTPSSACVCEEPNCAPSAQIKKRDSEWSSWSSGWESWAASESMASTATPMAASTMMPAPPASSPTMMAPAPPAASPMMSPSAAPMAPSMSMSMPMASAASSASACAPPAAGATITLKAASAIPSGSYVTFVSGLNVVSVQGTISGDTIMAQIPSVAAGQTYVFVSKADQEGSLVDTNVLFGPAIVEVSPAAPAIDYSIS